MAMPYPHRDRLARLAAEAEHVRDELTVLFDRIDRLQKELRDAYRAMQAYSERSHMIWRTILRLRARQ